MWQGRYVYFSRNSKGFKIKCFEPSNIPNISKMIVSPVHSGKKHFGFEFVAKCGGEIIFLIIILTIDVNLQLTFRKMYKLAKPTVPIVPQADQPHL